MNLSLTRVFSYWYPTKYISRKYIHQLEYTWQAGFLHTNIVQLLTHIIYPIFFFFLSRLLHKIGLPYQSVSLLVPLTKSPRRNKLLYFECRMSTLVVQWALYLIDRMPVPVGFRAVKRFG